MWTKLQQTKTENEIKKRFSITAIEQIFPQNAIEVCNWDDNSFPLLSTLSDSYRKLCIEEEIEKYFCWNFFA